MCIKTRPGGRMAGRAPAWVGSLYPAGRAHGRPRPGMGRVTMPGRTDARLVALTQNNNRITLMKIKYFVQLRVAFD